MWDVDVEVGCFNFHPSSNTLQKNLNHGITYNTYLIGSITFILGLKMLSNPKSQKRKSIKAATRNDNRYSKLFFFIKTMKGKIRSMFGFWRVSSEPLGTLAAKKVK